MNNSLGNPFDYFKERRYAAVFYTSLTAIVGAVSLGMVLYHVAALENVLSYWPLTLPGLGLMLLAFGWRWVRCRRAQRLNRYKSSPLSRDEWVKARTKLARKSIFKQK